MGLSDVRYATPMSPAALRDCMAVLGWSGTALAAQLGCQRALVQQWTHGKARIPPAVAQWLVLRVDAAVPLPAPAGWRTRSGRAEYPGEGVREPRRRRAED